MNGSISFSGDLTGSIDQGGGTGSVPVVTATATVDANTGTPEVSVTRTGTDANPNFNFGFKNLKGAKGDTGAAGQNGSNGSDGFSPVVTLSSISGGTRVSITDAAHPSGQVFDVMNGQNGQDGTDGTNGTNGVSPAVTISSITGGHRVNITDATHPSGQNFDVMDGQRGETGSQGPQGEQGPAGVGIAVGGTAGQILKKAGSSDYVTGWYDNEAAGVSFDNTGLEIISHDTVQLALEDLDAAVDSVNSSLAQKTEWHRVINQLVATGSNYDQTLTMDMPDYTPNEIMFCLMRESNSRTFATAVIPYNQYVNGAIYTGGQFTLYSGQMTSANIYHVNAVCIYVSSTQCEIALQSLTEAVRVRVFVR